MYQIIDRGKPREQFQFLSCLKKRIEKKWETQAQKFACLLMIWHLTLVVVVVTLTFSLCSHKQSITLCKLHVSTGCCCVKKRPQLANGCGNHDHDDDDDDGGGDHPSTTSPWFDRFVVENWDQYEIIFCDTSHYYATCTIFSPSL